MGQERPPAPSPEPITLAGAAGGARLDPEFEQHVLRPLLAQPALTLGAVPDAVEAEPTRGGVILRLPFPEGAQRVRLARTQLDPQPLARSREWEVASVGPRHWLLPARAWEGFLLTLDPLPELPVTVEPERVADHQPRRTSDHAPALPFERLPPALRLALRVGGSWQQTHDVLRPVMACLAATVPPGARASTRVCDVGAAFGVLVALMRGEGYAAVGLESARAVALLARASGVPVRVRDAARHPSSTHDVVTCIRVFDDRGCQEPSGRARRALLAGLAARVVPGGALLVTGPGELRRDEVHAAGFERWPWPHPMSAGPDVHRFRRVTAPRG